MKVIGVVSYEFPDGQRPSDEVRHRANKAKDEMTLLIRKSIDLLGKNADMIQSVPFKIIVRRQVNSMTLRLEGEAIMEVCTCCFRLNVPFSIALAYAYERGGWRWERNVHPEKRMKILALSVLRRAASLTREQGKEILRVSRRLERQIKKIS